MGERRRVRNGRRARGEGELNAGCCSLMLGNGQRRTARTTNAQLLNERRTANGKRQTTTANGNGPAGRWRSQQRQRQRQHERQGAVRGAEVVVRLTVRGRGRRLVRW